MRIVSTDHGDVMVDLDEAQGVVRAILCRTHQQSLSHDLVGKRHCCTAVVDSGVLGQDSTAPSTICPVVITNVQLENLKQDCWREIRERDQRERMRGAGRG